MILNTTEWELTARSALHKSMLEISSRSAREGLTSEVAALERRQTTALSKILSASRIVGAALAWQALDLPAPRDRSSVMSSPSMHHTTGFESKGKAWQWVVTFIDQCGGATDFYTPDVVLTKLTDASCCLPRMCPTEGEWCMPNGCMNDINLCEDHSNFLGRAIQRMSAKVGR